VGVARDPVTAKHPSDPPTALTDHDRSRLRATWRTAAAGPLLGILGAVAVAAIGGSGGAGLAVLLLLSAVGAVAAALLTAVHALVDEYRHRPVARRRLVMSIALFVAALVLLVLSGGAARAG